VVNFIRYRVDTWDGGEAWAGLFENEEADALRAYEANRTELIREEIAANGTVQRAELVAEYAVDLKVELLALDSVGQVRAIPDAEVLDWAGPVAALQPNQGPERIRAVRVRSSIRSRAPDRSAGMPNHPPAATDPLMRMGLGNNGGAPFARVRTLQAFVALRNHEASR
jgi:hypothetical protein